jgi:hypothetical protein
VCGFKEQESEFSKKNPEKRMDQVANLFHLNPGASTGEDLVTVDSFQESN